MSDPATRRKAREIGMRLNGIEPQPVGTKPAVYFRTLGHVHAAAPGTEGVALMVGRRRGRSSSR